MLQHIGVGVGRGSDQSRISGITPGSVPGLAAAPSVPPTGNVNVNGIPDGLAQNQGAGAPGPYAGMVQRRPSQPQASQQQGQAQAQAQAQNAPVAPPASIQAQAQAQQSQAQAQAQGMQQGAQQPQARPGGLNLQNPSEQLRYMFHVAREIGILGSTLR